MENKSHAVTMSNFEEVVETHEMVLLDFWATWCKPCATFSPVFEELATHNPDIFFGKVDTEASKDLAEAFQVKSVPMLMAFKKGELVWEGAGLLPPPQLEKLLENLRQAVVEVVPMEEEP